MTGRILSNRYELLEKVGGGGMAFVYRARDLRLNRIVAVKILSPHYTHDEDFVRKFRREAQAAASLSSPNIVGVFDVGQDGEIYYIVMEFLNGRTLKEVITENGPLEIAEALQIVKQIAEALEVAHKHGVVHRDIKPHNIMLTADGRIKVTDFGIARAATGATLTETGAMIGSVHYISPEQARGGIVGELSDIYSLGVVFYEMLTGQVPFPGESMFSIALKHLQEQPPPLRELNPAVPIAVERIANKAMSKELAGRYQTASALAEDVRRLLQTAEQDISLLHLLGSWENPLLNADGPDTEKTLSGPSPAEGEAKDKKGAAVDAPKRKFRFWPILLILAILGLLGATAMQLYSYFKPGAVVEVPDVVGMPFIEAQRVLTERELGFSVGLEEYSDEEPNVVLDQEPPAEREVRAGRVIVLTISKGPEYVDVPLVVGLPLREAQIELQNSGFPLAETINRVYSDRPIDEVVEQNPSGNTRLKPSTPVTLTVSQGPAPRPFSMSTLLGLTMDGVQQRLNELKLVLGDITGPMDGVVVAHNPEANMQVTAGQPVDLQFGPREIMALVSYTVPADSTADEHHLEILREDVHGLALDAAFVALPGETIQRHVTGSGFLRVVVKDGGRVVKEEVYP